MTSKPLSDSSAGYYQPIGRRRREYAASLTIRGAWATLRKYGDATIMTQSGDVTAFGGAHVLTIYTDIY